MGNQTVMIEIPGEVFSRLKRKAEFMHRPVEELVAQTLDVASPPTLDLPPELVAEFDAMLNYSDDALWAAVKPSISPTERARLEQLNHLAGERALSGTEEEEQSRLLAVWRRSAARRARALAILKLRGHPLPSTGELMAAIEDGR